MTAPLCTCGHERNEHSVIGVYPGESEECDRCLCYAYAPRPDAHQLEAEVERLKGLVREYQDVLDFHPPPSMGGLAVLPTKREMGVDAPDFGPLLGC